MTIHGEPRLFEKSASFKCIYIWYLSAWFSVIPKPLLLFTIRWEMDNTGEDMNGLSESLCP